MIFFFICFLVCLQKYFLGVKVRCYFELVLEFFYLINPHSKVLGATVKSESIYSPLYLCLKFLKSAHVQYLFIPQIY